MEKKSVSPTLVTEYAYKPPNQLFRFVFLTTDIQKVQVEISILDKSSIGHKKKKKKKRVQCRQVLFACNIFTFRQLLSDRPSAGDIYLDGKNCLHYYC